MISLSTLDRLEIRVDELLEHRQELKALNAELLAALIPLENWARGIANILGTTQDDGVTITPHYELAQAAETARSAIAKAKELE